MTTELMNSIKKVIDDMGLSMECTFVPWNGKDAIGLRWSVEISRVGISYILTVPYFQGIAHCPSYKSLHYRSVDEERCIKEECRTGCYATDFGSNHYAYGTPIPKPNIVDVLWCVILDSEVLDCPTFEEWCQEYGSDPDSRKAESQYRLCVSIGLGLLRLIGNDRIRTLRAAYVSY